MRFRQIVVVGILTVFVLGIGYGVGASTRIRAEQKTVYYRSDLNIRVDGKPTTLDVTPFIIDPGWIMVPIEFVSKELGAECHWNDATSTFSIATGIDGQASCKVEHTWPNGNRYVGEWKEGQPHGYGTYTWPEGDSYVGLFVNGMRHGQGTYVWPDGDKYVGEFHLGDMHGLGTYLFAKGDVLGGIWSDGVLIQPTETTVTSPTVDVIETRIKGTFRGWDGDTIFEMVNGQIWQQTSYSYTYHYAYRPQVVIFRSGLRYKMVVEGVTPWINVKRLN